MSKEKKQNINAPWTFVDMIKSHAMFIDSKGKKVIINLDKMTQPNEQRKEKDFWTEMNTGEQEKFVLEATRLKKDISFGLKLSTPPQPNSEWLKSFRELWKVSFENEKGTHPQTNVELFIEKTLTQARRDTIKDLKEICDAAENEEMRVILEAYAKLNNLTKQL